VNNLVEVRRKEGESIEGLLRRFTKKLQQSGRLLTAKKNRFYQPPPNKREIKEDALRRKSMREVKEYLRKIGRLDDIRDPKKISQILKLTLKKKKP